MPLEMENDLRLKLGSNTDSNSPLPCVGAATLYSDNFITMVKDHQPDSLSTYKVPLVVLADSDDNISVVSTNQSEESQLRLQNGSTHAVSSPSPTPSPEKERVVRSKICFNQPKTASKLKTFGSLSATCRPTTERKDLKPPVPELQVNTMAISSDSEEDVTTTIMKFNRFESHRKLKDSSKSAIQNHSSQLEEENIKVLHSGAPESTRSKRKRKIPNLVAENNTVKKSLIEQNISYESYHSFDEYEGEEVDHVKSGIKQYSFFSSKDCTILEQMIDDQIVDKIDTFKSCTVDRAPLRNKYFFGEGYTYGTQMKRKGPGMEELYPKGFVDDIPEWVTTLVIKPLVKAKIIPSDYINSCVINDYRAGGCIISHIDPKQLFDRPIYTISLLSDCALSFGVKFTFKPIRCSRPVYQVPLKRGCITSISGYAADNITHCVRPQDTERRRAVIILRRVFDDAPRLPSDYQITPKQENGVNHYHNRQRYNERRSGYDRSRYRRSEQEHRSDHHRNQGSDNDEERKRKRHSEPIRSEPRSTSKRYIRQ